MYYLKQLIAALAMPLTAALLIALLAGALRALNRRRTATWLFVVAAVLIYLSSISPVGNALIAPLEHQYPLLDESKPFLHDVRYIVVLGTGYAPRRGIPTAASLDDDGLVRIVEGVRLARRLPSAQLVLSGGTHSEHESSAVGYARVARSLGVSQASIVILEGALDTEAETAAVAALLDKAPFILVTSAYHMPRSVRLMKLAGLQPIPAPAGHTARPLSFSWRWFLPTSLALRKTERALHEYLAFVASSARA